MQWRENFKLKGLARIREYAHEVCAEVRDKDILACWVEDGFMLVWSILTRCVRAWMGKGEGNSLVEREGAGSVCIKRPVRDGRASAVRML